MLKIKADGKGCGKPTEKNPFNMYEGNLNPKWKEWDDAHPTLPLYLPNNEPYLKDDVVEGVKIDQLFSFAGGWVDKDKVTGFTKYIRETRQIYRITPSAPDNDKKVAEVREVTPQDSFLALEDIDITYNENSNLVIDDGDDFQMVISKNDTIKLRDFLNSLPL